MNERGKYTYDSNYPQEGFTIRLAMAKDDAVDTFDSVKGIVRQLVDERCKFSDLYFKGDILEDLFGLDIK